MSRKTWLEDIKTFIPELLDGEANEKNAILLNALYDLQGHLIVEDDKDIDQSDKMPQMEESGVDMGGKNEWIINQISEELNDANTYYEKWLETKNKEYKKIASDELQHSEILVKIAREDGLPDAELQDIRTRHNILLAKLH